MLAFILIQYTNSLMSSHVFSMLMWLLCSCLRICFYNIRGRIMHLLFIVIALIMVSSCLICQFLSAPHSTASLESGHLPLLYLFSISSSPSSSVADLISSIDVKLGTSTDVFIACILTFILGISWLSMLLCQDSKSTMNNLGLDLYRICTLYWYMYKIIHYSCCYIITTSLLIMATSSLW